MASGNINLGYKLKKTDSQESSITLPRRIFIDDIVDIILIGKRTTEYGEELNENILHLMEHFSCPSIEGNNLQPDPDQKLSTVLRNPLLGQLWYNSVGRFLCVWTGLKWEKFTHYGNIAGNSGFIFDGENIPLPVNRFGESIPSNHCHISISPVFFGTIPKNYTCYVEHDGTVNCKYTSLDNIEISTYASFAIICHDSDALPPVPTPTITPTTEPVLQLIWDIGYTSNGGSIQNGNIFYVSTNGIIALTRTNKRIGPYSYFNLRITDDYEYKSMVGICDELFDTRDPTVRPGLSQSGIEITSDGRVITHSTVIHTFSPSSDIVVDFAVNGNMVWVRINLPTTMGTPPWIGGGDPETLSNPTTHLTGTKFHAFGGINDSMSSILTLNNTIDLTSGIVPAGYSKANFI